MSFTITLYHNKSEDNRLDKNLELIGEFQGTLRDSSSLIDPVILFDSNISDLKKVNYMYIENFGRYYFVKNITSVRSYLVQLDCHVDVLSTYKAAIRGNNAIIRRNEKMSAPNINDGYHLIYQNPNVVQYKFNGSRFDHWEWVLAMSGGEGSSLS